VVSPFHTFAICCAQDKNAVLLDVRTIIAEQLATDIDKVGQMTVVLGS
jgi:hypothetical protein